MQTLLKKRQARAAVKAALVAAANATPAAAPFALGENTEESAPQSNEVSTGKSASNTATNLPIHNPLKGKSWSDIQYMLEVDLELVRTLPGFDEKNAFRAELIKKYQATAQALLATKKSFEGLDLLWWYFLWQVDCGQLEQVHDDFKAAVERGLSTPRRWNTNGQTAFCDIVFKHAHAAYREKREFNHIHLAQLVADISHGKFAINSALKVKMYRLVGDLMLEAGRKQEALILFKAVMAIDPNRGGRKTLVQELTEELGDCDDSKNS